MKLDLIRQCRAPGYDLILRQFGIFVAEGYAEQKFHGRIDAQLLPHRVGVVTQYRLRAAGKHREPASTASGFAHTYRHHKPRGFHTIPA